MWPSTTSDGRDAHDDDAGADDPVQSEPLAEQRPGPQRADDRDRGGLHGGPVRKWGEAVAAHAERDEERPGRRRKDRPPTPADAAETGEAVGRS